MEISRFFIFFIFYHFLLFFAKLEGDPGGVAGNEGPYPRRIWHVRRR
jgi:hypothetical protein